MNVFLFKEYIRKYKPCFITGFAVSFGAALLFELEVTFPCPPICCFMTEFFTMAATPFGDTVAVLLGFATALRFGTTLG